MENSRVPKQVYKKGECVVDVFRKGKFELLVQTETKLKGNEV